VSARIRQGAQAAGRQQVDVVLDADCAGPACRVGTLFHAAAHGRATFSFAYDPEWLKRPDTFEIDPDLQLHTGESYPSGAAGVFRIFLDSAPDRWGRLLLDRRELLRAREDGRRPRTLTEWDYLLGVHDTCRIGALRFRREEASPFLDADQQLAAPPLASLRELEAASLALEAPDAAEQPQFRRWLTALMAPGSSLGGARPKANFTDTDGALWIAKFPSRDDRRDIGAWEMVVHQLAKATGVHVPEARTLALASPHRTFACRRFDRTTANRRRFFVSAMTLLGRVDGQGGSYLDLAEFLSTRGSTRHRTDDLKQLWTRVVFNILVSNTDDHLRNHGFILEPDGWRLAPAYDLNANIERTAHALSIDAADTTPDVGLALDTAEYYGLDAASAGRILRKVKGTLRTWTERAAALRLPREEVDLMAQAFRPER
jgi:serine/threonine-protein kinase HipA